MSEIHALSGAYAVDALDDLERVSFERHLAGCATCRQEVGSLREASALLPDTLAVEPPASLRASVLDQIATVRPLPPVVAEVVVPAPASRRPWRGLVAAAAAVVLLGAGGAVAWDRPWRDAPASTQLSAADVMRAPDAQKVVRSLEQGGTITVVRSASLNTAVVMADGMPPAPSGHVYELWLQQGDVMVEAGLMPADGDTAVIFDGNAATAVGAGITVEPEGGSTQPTGELVAAFPFDEA